jgi:hypothetical protein
MKKFIKIISICALSLSLMGCSSIFKKNEGVTGKSTKAEEKAAVRVDVVNEAIVMNDRQKLQTIGIFAAGTDYALSKVPEPPKEVEVARELNARILNLAESPALEQLKAVHTMVDDLVSTLQAQQEKGLHELARRDESIYMIQMEKRALESAKEQEIKKYMDVAQAAASKADQYASTLGDMDSMWGLGAIFYGIKRLITRAAIFIGIFAFIYLLLRVVSTMHPAGAAAFQIFDLIASAFMNIIKGLAPGAAKIAKLVPEAAHTIYKQTLGHVVDTIELLKIQDKKDIAAGQPSKKYTLNEILAEFDKAMDQPHKDTIKNVKSDMNWK